MEELKKFQSSTFDTIARRRVVEDQDTILELTGKIQELQNEINFLERYESTCVFPTSSNSWRTLSRSTGMPSRRDGPPSIWDTHVRSGNVFVNPDASSTAPYPQELNPWSSSTEEPLHSSTAEKNENQTQDQDLRCQSGPSAKSSVIPGERDSSKNYGADQQRLQISDLHLHRQRLLVGR